MTSAESSRATTSTLPLLRSSLRRMLRRPLQYILFVLGVAVGVAMMVSIDLANESANRAFQLSTDAVAGKATHRIVDGFSGLDESIYVRLRREVGYTLSAPVVEGYVKVAGLGNQPMRLVGVDFFAEPPFRDYLAGVSAGQSGSDTLNSFFTRPNALVFSQTLAERYGVQRGDNLVITVDGTDVDASVVELLVPSDDVARRGLDNLLFTDIANAQTLLGMTGQLSHIDLIVPEGTALAAITALLPASARIEPAAASSNAIQQMIAAFDLNLTAMSLLALVVGMFLIYNTVTFSVVQRRKLFGIFRSLGVTGGQLLTLILIESVLLSLIGSVLGLALGVLLGRVMVGLVTTTINDFYFVVNVQEVSLPLVSLAKGLLIGIGAALVASLPPALDAMRTAPGGSLRRSNLESRVQRLAPWLVPVWLVLTLIGAFLLGFRYGGLYLDFTGLFAILLAFALLSPPLTLWLMRWLAPVGGRLLGPLGRLAPRDIARSLSRTSIAIAALMTAVSVIIGVSIMIGSFRGTVSTWLNSVLQADIYISPPAITASRSHGTIQPEVLDRLDEYPGVDQLITGRNVSVFAPDLGRNVELISASGDVSAGQRHYAWTDGGEDLWARFDAGEGLFVSEPLVLREQLSMPPGPITLMTATGPRQFPVLAVYYDYSSDQGTILIDHDLFVAEWQDEAISNVALVVRSGVDVDTLVTTLQEDLLPIQDLQVRSNQGLREASLDIFDRTFAVTTALQLLAVVVAFIGVLSALLSLQLERSRELGVLRATGMTEGQLWRLTLLETGLMGGLAGLLAIPAGFVMAWILIYVINVRSFGWTLEMQLMPGYFLQALAVAVVAALLAGIYPASRLGRMVIATAIRQD